MGALMFSSATGGKPKAILYSNDDFKRMHQAMAHFWALCPTDGVVLNTLPAYPNLGYHFAKMYEEFCPKGVIHTGGYGLTDIKKHLELMDQFKPTLLIAIEAMAKELYNLAGKPNYLKIIVVPNGLTFKTADYFKEHKIDIRATYGLTEAKQAWITKKDFTQGYYIYKENGLYFKNEGDELILYSIDYPTGFRTGDLAKVIDFKDYQKIDFLIRRKDGKSKKLIGCTR